MEFGYVRKVWKIEEVGDYSIVVSSIAELKPSGIFLLPNPNEEFIKVFGKMDIPTFKSNFEIPVKELVHTPETLVIYFEEKVPKWMKVGMEILY